MTREEIEDLLDRYNSGNATESEKALVESWYNKFVPPASPGPEHLKKDQQESLQRLLANIDTGRGRSIGPWYIAAAAALVMFTAFGAYHFISGKKDRPQPYSVKTIPRDIAPGSDKATLTLANGKTINISDTKNGTIATQAGVQIAKTADGHVAYESSNAASTVVDFNTISVPRGGKYELVLADGTKVWLNSASTLKFPTVFSGGDRVVELTGEAFFEVAHNAKKPFKVKTPGQLVQDIGTQFNVNSYADEDAVATTLVEGSVKIINAKGQTLIKPGQQYLLKNNGAAEIKNEVDLDEVTAWKSGFFQFNNADIKTIMRQVSRWYDVDVEYEGKVPASTYHGRISRNSNASTVLKILELSGINFTIERGKIIVK
ncbi:MAG: FecR family protein [Sphingobacteriales bacterium]